MSREHEPSSEIQKPLARLEAAKWSDEEWHAHQQGLVREPYLRLGWKEEGEVEQTFRDVGLLFDRGYIEERATESLAHVDPKRVIRAPSFDSWATAYHSPHGEDARARGETSVEEIAKGMVRALTSVERRAQGMGDAYRRKLADEALSRYFKPEAPVFLRQVNGPRGPVYFVQDGSHRTAAAKLAGLSEMRAKIGGVPRHNDSDRDWFFALAMMTPEEREAMKRVYDEVYPPTEEDRARESVLQKEGEKLFLQKKEQLSEEIAGVRKKAYDAWVEKPTSHIPSEYLEKPGFLRVFNRLAIPVIKEFRTFESFWEPEKKAFEDHYLDEPDEEGNLVRVDGESEYGQPFYLVPVEDRPELIQAAIEVYKKEFESA